MTRPELYLHPLFPDGIRAVKPVPIANETRLEAFSITADSVVATVLMTPGDENRAAQIHWGDDTVDFVDFRKPVLQTGANVPPGSFKLQHVYRKFPASGHYPNRVIVMLAIYSDGDRRSFEGTALDLEPRFRCTLYPTVVKATHHDTGLEEVSEFDITMRISQDRVLVDRQWRWEPKTFDIGLGGTTVGIVAERVLDGSGVTTEMTLGGPTINVSMNYVDDDGTWGFLKQLGGVLTTIPAEFDTSVDIGLEIDPRVTEGPFDFVRTYGSGTEYFQFHVSGSMDLIVPIDRGPVATLD